MRKLGRRFEKRDFEKNAFTVLREYLFEKTNTYDQSAMPRPYKTPISISAYSFLLSKNAIKKNRFFESVTVEDPLKCL